MTGPVPAAEPSLVELRHRFQTGQDTPLDAVTRMLARIDEHDGQLHAFLAVDREGALTQADLATRAWRRRDRHPTLLGIPISVKDTIEVAGMPTTYGSRVFVDNIRPDSLVARRLRDQGAIIIGKTNTPEFALVTEVRNRITPPGRNPLDTGRTCGGSSGGAAASVRAGMSTAAIGTDSAGSIRIPAAYQGLVGFKPSYQRIPWVQDWKASLTRSHTGPITQSIADARMLTHALSGYDWHDPSSAFTALTEHEFRAAERTVGSGLRVAVLTDDDAPSTPQDDTLLADLTGLVCDSFPDTRVRDWRTLATPPALNPSRCWPYAAEHVAAALALRADFYDHLDELTDYARPIYQDGHTQTGHDYLAATGAERRRGLELRQALAVFDYAFSLVAPEAPPIRDDYVPLTFPRLALLNLAGLPAVSIPFGHYASGMPRAIQVIGRFGDDAGVLAVADRLTTRM